MTTAAGLVLVIAKGVLAAASVLVPAQFREEWLREWRAEVDALGARSSKQAGSLWAAWLILYFVLGSLCDSAYLWRRQVAKDGWLRSPYRVTGPLVLAALVTGGLCLATPATRSVLLPALHSTEIKSFLISDTQLAGADLHGVVYGTFRQWRTQRSQGVEDSAFFTTGYLEIKDKNGASARVPAVFSTPALIELANIRLLAGAVSLQPGANSLILSEGYWKRHLGGRLSILGETFLYEGHAARVAGIAAGDAWPLPGRPAVWLLSADQPVLRESQPGFILASFHRAGLRRVEGSHWESAFWLNEDEGAPHVLEGETLGSRESVPLQALGLGFLLALVLLPLISDVTLGEYPHGGERPQPWATSRRWVFLFLKLGLLTLTVSFATTGFAYGLGAFSWDTAECLTFLVGFTGFLCSFTWALRDQRQRCPVCLSLLRNPVDVGYASRTLLAWSGTEWICLTGHGFLHVPQLQTSWLSTQRWLAADPSWQPSA